MQRVKPHIPCVDHWPPGSCTQAAMQAYVELERTGAIAIDKVQICRNTGRVIVRYYSAAPQEWVRESMGKIKRAFQGENSCE